MQRSSFASLVLLALRECHCFYFYCVDDAVLLVSPTRLDSPAADVELGLRSHGVRSPIRECAKVRILSITAQIPVASVSAAVLRAARSAPWHAPPSSGGTPPRPRPRLACLLLSPWLQKERDDAEEELLRVAAPHAARSGRIDPPPSPPSSVYSDGADPRPAHRGHLVALETARSAQRGRQNDTGAVRSIVSRTPLVGREGRPRRSFTVRFGSARSSLAFYASAVSSALPFDGLELRWLPSRVLRSLAHKRSL